MKNFLLGTVALIALGAAVPAIAADMAPRSYTKAPAYVAAPIYNWTGFYVGGNIGGAFGGGNGFTGAVNNSSSNGKFMGGVQGGYNYQFAPNWVIGVEAQYDWTSNSGATVTFPLAPAYTYNTSLNGLGSVTGRLGYTWGPAMLYAKGGYAFTDRSRSVTGLPAVGVNGNTDGYTVGGGLEYMFTQNWSGNIEYQYYNFGKTTFASAPLDAYGSATSEQHTVKAGLNYHFNLGNFGSGMVPAKY
ncbi:porin family protein [Tardiphaga sp. vice352]|uniref:outer membrane protein n=1 Tax=Tardiphaga sp. vice352 TaxID=2592816 RepID=UPI001165B255|nr:outer membrane beta-barrel protein [Tardiphaga sp. vice352]QDM30538.1 porin family protein [Tardiphaga sp. vice352]